MKGPGDTGSCGRWRSLLPRIPLCLYQRNAARSSLGVTSRTQVAKAVTDCCLPARGLVCSCWRGVVDCGKFVEMGTEVEGAGQEGWVKGCVGLCSWEHLFCVGTNHQGRSTSKRWNRGSRQRMGAGTTYAPGATMGDSVTLDHCNIILCVSVTAPPPPDPWPCLRVIFLTLPTEHPVPRS